MMMRRLARGAVLAGASAAMIGLGAGPAFAATTWTVTPGGAITAKANKTVLTDTTTGNMLTCVTSKVYHTKASVTKATLKSGSGLKGYHIGKITSVAFNNCTAPLGLTFVVKTSASSTTPWWMNARTYNATAGAAIGYITGIHAVLTGPSCHAIVDGTGAYAHNGKVKFKYLNAKHRLVVLTSGGNLHVYHVKGCSGLIKSGNATTFHAAYNVSPAQTITSP